MVINAIFPLMQRRVII